MYMHYTSAWALCPEACRGPESLFFSESIEVRGLEDKQDRGSFSPPQVLPHWPFLFLDRRCISSLLLGCKSLMLPNDVHVYYTIILLYYYTIILVYSKTF